MTTNLERPSTFRHIRFAYRVGQKFAKQEANNTVEWTTWNSRLESYEITFRNVFSQDLSSFLMSRMQEGKSAHVLDLMGPGSVLRELPLRH